MKTEPLNPENEKIMQDKMDTYMEASRHLTEAFEENRRLNDIAAAHFWNSLSYEDKCNAFHAVVSKIFQGDIREKGSYRYVLYDVFGFSPDMYTRGMDCGYMALHNAIFDGETLVEMKSVNRF